MLLTKKKNNRVLIILLLTTILIFYTGSKFMTSIFKGMVLFSPVVGVVYDGDRPLGGVVVERSFQWKDISEIEKVLTSESGEFSFESKVAHSIMWRIIPHNPVVMQRILIRVDDKSYDAWEYQKGDYLMNSEADGKTLRLHCDIQDEPQSHTINDLFSYWGIATLR